MKPSIIRPYAALLVLVALLSACSGPTGESGSSNTNAPQEANSNSAEQPRVAQSNAAPSTPPAVQTLPSPEPKAAGDAVKPAGEPPADRNVNTANAASARSPKLVAPNKKLDFGKQPQDKTLVRAIAIRNGGRADLNIDSVVPS